ncbi:MAG: metal-dependent hydrolase [Clostridia bacterium]|nr:metal-dependent hydrolase [Clostridia bacterium]
MDPITHGLVGGGIAMFSGGQASLSDPIFLGSILGSMAPDLDIVMQFRGDVAYLRHHRGFSHSIPGLGLLSAAIALVLKAIFPQAPLGEILLWTFLGALSHTILDVMNSYGAQLFGPLDKRRVTANILQIFDPVLVFLAMGMVVLPNWALFRPSVAVGVFGLYLVFRYVMRIRLCRRLVNRYRSEGIVRVVVMPAIWGLFTWDYLVETGSAYIVGQVNFRSCGVMERRCLVKPGYNKVIDAALESKMGKMFREFTPYFHVAYYLEGGKHIVKFLDLRYFLKSDFLHSATIVFDQQWELLESFFHPYNAKRNIKV